MTSWQEVSEMMKSAGAFIFKKQNRSRTLWVGGSASFLGVLAVLMMLTGMSSTYTDNGCRDDYTTCVEYLNVTSTYWRVCFAEDFQLIQTEPSGISVDVYVPTYGKKWRKWNPLKDCIERGKINKFKIVGHKPKELTVKWWSDGLKVPDPLWVGDSSTNVTVSVCQGINESFISSEYYSPNSSAILSLLNFSNNVTMAGNYSWNYSEQNVAPFNCNGWLYNLSNAGNRNVSVLIKINATSTYYELWCYTANGTKYLNVTDTYQVLENVTTSTAKYINCTVDFINLSQTYVNWNLTDNKAQWHFNATFNITIE